jgi:hypothetical protein
LTYGIDVQEGDDPFVSLIERANSNFNKATIPGSFLVDFFPSMKNLPEWLPGMEFMETARRWAADTLEMVEAPYKHTLQQIVRSRSTSQVPYTQYFLSGGWNCIEILCFYDSGGRQIE